MKVVAHIPRMRNMRNEYNILVGELEGKKSLQRSWRRFEDNIKNCLKYKWCKATD